MQRCFAVIQVVASINQKLQELAAQAQQAAASGTSNTASLMALRTSISKLAAVQQQDMVASIGNLAAKYAADPTYDASVDLADFTVVSTLSDLSRQRCSNLTMWCRGARLRAVAEMCSMMVACVFFAQAYNEENVAKLAEAKAVNNTAILELMQALGATEDDFHHSSAWIAGPVIGGVVAAALLACVCYWVHTKYWIKPTIPCLLNAAAGSDGNVHVYVPTSGAKYAVNAAAQVGLGWSGQAASSSARLVPVGGPLRVGHASTGASRGALAICLPLLPSLQAPTRAGAELTGSPGHY